MRIESLADTQMAAAWYDHPGTAREVLQVGALKAPVPGPGELRVRVHWSGVNPTDVKRRAGASGPLPGPRVIPHMDGSGVVDAVGAGVDPARVGQRVWLHRAGWKRALGTCATHCVLPQALAVPLPDGIDLRMGATLGVPALTAHRAVFGFGDVRGRTVLVTGGAGAVGFYAIQLARWGGAHVIATASGERKQAEALRAGAQAVIDYRRENVTERVLALTGGQGVDHLVEVDFGGNLAATTALMKPYGTIAAYASAGERQPALPFYPLQAKAITLMLVALFDLPQTLQAQASADVSRWLQEGEPRLPPVREFSLAEVADAHEAVEAGALGRTLIRLTDDSIQIDEGSEG